MQWLVSCHVPELSSLVVLDLHWLSRVLLEVLLPEPENDLRYGKVSKRGLVATWLRKGLVDSEGMAEQLLAVLWGLRVTPCHGSRQEGEEGEALFVPHRITEELSGALLQCLEHCVGFPHGGFRVAERRGEGPCRVLDPFVVCQLFNALGVDLDVFLVSRCLALVRLVRQPHWFAIGADGGALGVCRVELEVFFASLCSFLACFLFFFSFPFPLLLLSLLSPSASVLEIRKNGLPLAARPGGGS